MLAIQWCTCKMYHWWVCGCCRAKSKSHDRQWVGFPKQHLKKGSELLLSCGWNAALQEMPIRTHQIYMPTRVRQKLGSRLEALCRCCISSVLHRALVLDKSFADSQHLLLRCNDGKSLTVCPGGKQRQSGLSTKPEWDYYEYYVLYSKVSILDFWQRAMMSL